MLRLYKTDKTNTGVEANRTTTLTIASGATGTIDIYSDYTFTVFGLYIGHAQKAYNIKIYEMLNLDRAIPVWGLIIDENRTVMDKEIFQVDPDFSHQDHYCGVRIQITSSEAVDTLYYMTTVVKETQMD